MTEEEGALSGDSEAIIKGGRGLGEALVGIAGEGEEEGVFGCTGVVGRAEVVDLQAEGSTLDSPGCGMTTKTGEDVECGRGGGGGCEGRGDEAGLPDDKGG